MLNKLTIFLNLLIQFCKLYIDHKMGMEDTKYDGKLK